MAIHVALNHKTTYRYDRRVHLSPQIVRLRPAPHCRTPIRSYSLRVAPSDHFLNWQQDPQGNYQARLVFTQPVISFEVEVDLVAEMTVINPFDFFLESSAERFPFTYEAGLAHELRPFLATEPLGPKLSDYVNSIDRAERKTVDFLVDLNCRLQKEIKYLIRMEPGVQTCEQTLALGSGSCRDTAWLLAQILRNLGLAARFVSGYLIQLAPDVKPLDGPVGPPQDFTDLHAWTEVYLPGAGWVGLDPTSGLLAGEGHIPVACTPDPTSAAPISGAVEKCETEFTFAMSVTRVHEDPRVTKPYTDEQWRQIESLGHDVDRHLTANDVRLTMGGEPTFVSIDDMQGDEWNTAALGPTKQRLATDLIYRLKNRFGPGGLLHFGEGKWYPGESLPRWALHCYWRHDGEPLWRNDALFADPWRNYGHTVDDAKRFAVALAQRLGVNHNHVILGYEDVLYYTWKERRLPKNLNVLHSRLEDEEERERLARIFERGVTAPVGCVLPLKYEACGANPGWRSGPWIVRTDEMFLLPGDSPMGLRLPIQSLTWVEPAERHAPATIDPFAERAPLPMYATLRSRHMVQPALVRETVVVGAGPAYEQVSPQGGHGAGSNGHGRGRPLDGDAPSRAWPENDAPGDDIRLALCVEPREGRLHVFLPPTESLEHFVDLIAAIEDTAESLDLPIQVEGYPPPRDPRLEHIKVTPDPGVLEVNVHPAHSWDQLVQITTGVYDDARQARLGTEKFDLNGAHTGTGGGNHVVLGGPTPADSPFLRRPDLLRSLVAYWHNHPSLSYLFSSKFIGPTSQAPRVDEGRRDAIYELQIAFEQVPDRQTCPPWVVDRVFRNLLVDVTGNTHRAEFCIDKLYSPDTSTGRLGLVEFRAFEMPPHARMSLTQQLLLRALVARFWEQPYNQRLVPWDTTIHDRFLLPHFVKQDFEEVIEETSLAGFPLEAEWFAPHFEFRFPKIGEIAQRGLHLELRQAIEPWYVLGEEPGAGFTARYVDSSVERLQVKVEGMIESRYVLTCNGRKVPLHPTGTVGEFVAGVRYRAWQPPNCLHPTIPVDDPLVFDIVDAWMNRSLGGCRYYTGHPGGLNPETFPINANEAESRRAARFFGMGHTPGRIQLPPDEPNHDFPFTLDLRRNKGPQHAAN
jgi:uncharacterized protein (DUF2126 family)/transglutaminase-like putative cysteine protease